MHRRRFLASAAAIPFGLAGCGTSPEKRRANQAAKNAEARQQQLDFLAAFKVPPELVRTTPKRSFDLLKEFPDLKSRIRVAIRLHPRYSDEPKPHESKLGGQFLWPASDPWPQDEKAKLSFQPILQLRLEDAPAQLKFPNGKDLLQLLWLPNGDASSAKVVWRKVADVQPPLAAVPGLEHGEFKWIPVPCRLFPERVPELPSISSLPQGELRQKLEAWKPPAGESQSGSDYYEQYLSSTPGTKIGGYPWQGKNLKAEELKCSKCQWPMDYTLTIAGDDYAGDKKWAPLEEAEAKVTTGFAKATQCEFSGNNHVHVYLCRRCEAWPAKAVRG